MHNFFPFTCHTSIFTANCNVVGCLMAIIANHGVSTLIYGNIVHEIRGTANQVIWSTAVL